MKKTIILLIILQNYLFSYNPYDSYYNNYYNSYLHERNRILEKKIDEEERRRHEQEIDRLNRQAEIENEKYYRTLEYDNQKPRYKNNAYIEKKYNKKHYRNKSQIILGELHIVGIKSIKPFKDNKYIIEADNGTFALPIDKFKKAKKINFSKRLQKSIKMYNSQRGN